MPTLSLLTRLTTLALAGTVLGLLPGCGDAARSGTLVALEPTVQCLGGGVSAIDGTPTDGKKVVFTWSTPSGASTHEFTRFAAGAHLEFATPTGATRVDAVVFDKAGKKLTSAGSTCTSLTTEAPLPAITETPLPVVTEAPITVGGSPDTTTKP